MTNRGAKYLQVNLLRNSLDFLLSAAEAVERNSGTRSLKEATLHLADASELLIKARLVEEHWSLLFFSLEQASQDKLSSDDLRTVDFPKAVDRLKNIAGVELNDSLIENVTKLRSLRNKLTHYTADLDVAQTKSLVSKTMQFCVEFIEGQGMGDRETEYRLGEIQTRMVELREFVDGRIGAINSEFEEYYIQFCLNCSEYAMVTDSDKADCKFCRFITTPQILAGSRAEESTYDCPECWATETFAHIFVNGDNMTWHCFACGGGSRNYGHCPRCDAVVYSDPPKNAGFCDPCIGHIKSQ